MTGDDRATCGLCGLARDPADAEALAWGRELEGGRARWMCPDCARHHARAIEARLATDWW